MAWPSCGTRSLSVERPLFHSSPHTSAPKILSWTSKGLSLPVHRCHLHVLKSNRMLRRKTLPMATPTGLPTEFDKADLYLVNILFA